MAKYKLPEEESSDVKSWELPFMEEDKSAQDTSKTNAFNRRSDWKYEPPEPEPEEIEPPTAQEIEAIREAAQQDGFEQGFTEGMAKGLEEGRAKGLEEGYASGHEKGYVEGLEQAKTEVEAQVLIWKDLIENLHHPVSRVEEQLENEVVKLAVSLARAVIRSEVKTNKDLIFQALSEGLKVLPVQEKQYQVHLHPDDIKLIRQHFSEEEIARHNWSFIEAPQLTRGGCDITTENNAVDVSVERRCREVLDAFLLQQGLGQTEQE